MTLPRSLLHSSRWLLILWIGVLTATVPVPPVDACGPYYFEYLDTHPKAPDDRQRYRGGELGVFQPTYSVDDLWVAYRLLNDLPLPVETETDPEPMTDAEDHARSRDLYQRINDWQDASAARRQGPDPRRINPEKGEVRQENGFESFVFYINCLGDAFDSATERLDWMVRTYGDDSPLVQRWIEGQDAVFARCSGEGPLPLAAKADWPEPLQAERRYQVASAHFYGGDFEPAADGFRALADDPQFRRPHLADYLVARSLGRAGELRQAIERLDRILSRPDLVSVHEASRRLRGHLQFRDNPAAALRRVSKELSAERLDSHTPQNLIDLQQGLRKLRSAVSGEAEVALQGSAQDPSGEDPGEDLLAWMRWMDGLKSESVTPGEALRVAEGRFQAGGGRHWWLAAAMAAEGLKPVDPKIASRLLAAVPDLPHDRAPGAAALAYHRAQLRFAQIRGEGDQAARSQGLEEWEQDVRQWMERAGGRSDRNRFQALYRRAAGDLEGYLERSLFVPAAGTWDGYEIEPMPSLGPYGGPELPVDALFDREAIERLNGLDPETLIAAAKRHGEGALPAIHRRRLALVAWVRGVVLERWDWAVEQAEVVAKLVEPTAPDLASDLRRLSSAKSEDRPFLAALLILRSPGLEPLVHRAEGWAEAARESPSTGFGWWCAESVGSAPVHSLAAAPLVLAPWIFAASDRLADHPDMPEALHLLVGSTRRSCGQGQGVFGATSKKAFQRLHRRYPGHPLTAQTPYWFD